MNYNWKRYMKQQCPNCSWTLARKREEITEDSPSLCCHCKTLMEDITPVNHYVNTEMLAKERSLIRHQIMEQYDMHKIDKKTFDCKMLKLRILFRNVLDTFCKMEGLGKVSYEEENS